MHAPKRWLRGLWEYYREYTHTAIHTAAAAALTGFGLLVFVDPLFAAVAIASYVCPPVILYVVDGRDSPERAESDAPRSAEVSARPSSTTGSNTDGDADTDSDDGDSDADGDDGDSDADGDDGDADSDS